MNAVSAPKLTMRPFLPADAPLLAEIFRASISELSGDDYTEAQQEAWMSAADDEQEFGKRLGGQTTLVALLDGSPVAFASLKGADHIDMLYVHPAASSLGAATMLADALEKLAGARGAAKLIVEASDTAHEFFKSRGFIDQQRNTVLRGGEWLANTTMAKQLAPKGEAG
jgi:putative acetyltransferase